MDPLFEANSPRYTLFPIKYPHLFALGKQAVASFWTVDEIDLSDDRSEVNALPLAERKLLLNVLAFFAAADGIVMSNISINFSQVPISECAYFYAIQNASEAIHSEMYSLLIDIVL